MAAAVAATESTVPTGTYALLVETHKKNFDILLSPLVFFSLQTKHTLGLLCFTNDSETYILMLSLSYLEKVR